MNESRKRALTRRALAAGGSSAALLSKAQALGELARAGELAADITRREAEAVLDEPDRGTYAHQRAVTMCSKLLDELDRVESRGYSWQNMALDSDQRRAWFELDLLAEMARALGYVVGRVEWRAGSERVGRLERDAAVILADGDPPAAFDAWRERVEGRV